MRRRSQTWRVGLTFLALFAASCVGLFARPALADGPIDWTLRTRVARAEGGPKRAVERTASWEPARTAVIVCDMWDSHHCLNATRRGAELAPRMDRVLKVLRDRGATIIHAPSNCMPAYETHPGRERARATPRSKTFPDKIGLWCTKIPSEEAGTYPIDQTDGSEDDDPDEHRRWVAHLAAIGRNPKLPWKAQTDLIAIDPDRDFISEGGEEIWSILEARQIAHVILVGVHANMCVLGRPFGLRNLAQAGREVVLMRDMTDTMYNPARAPFVNHFAGTDLIVEHIESHVAPTISSEQILGGRPFRFRDDRRPRVAFLIAEDEYRTAATLPEFAASHLGDRSRVDFAFDNDDHSALSGLGVLDDADVAVVSLRRRSLPEAQIAAIRRHVDEGRAIVGLRTANHAFAPRPDALAPGSASWPTFDADVLGGHYQGHHGEGPQVAIAPSAPAHPILAGVTFAAFVGHGSLYKVSPIAGTAVPILIGTIPGQQPEPVAWTNIGPAGNRVFYTSLGHPDDFRDPAFNRLLANAIEWASGRN